MSRHSTLTSRGSVVAILPTRNEAGSLDWVIGRLIAAGASVVVVDDASPDGTAALAAKLLRRRRARGTILRRPRRRGRGSAVSDGMRLALSRYPRADFFLELDADGSHDPAELSRLLRCARRREADLVIGSRQPRASDKGAEWPLYRRLFHAANGRLIGAVLRLPTSDPTNGMRLWSRRAAALVGSLPLREGGFIWVAESTDAVRRAGGRICEVPTSFYPRRAGSSKAGLGEILRSLGGLLRVALAPVRVRRFTDIRGRGARRRA